MDTNINPDTSMTLIKPLFDVILNQMSKIVERFDDIEKRFDQLTKLQSSCLPASQSPSFSTPESFTNSVLSETGPCLQEQQTPTNSGLHTAATAGGKGDSFFSDKQFHKNKWINSRNEDYQILWNSDEFWVKAAETHFPEMAMIRFVF